ncbi:MAG: tyrosine--tRNA ligase, partial [Microthrixaceae bacterium]|nr:tyrosine--tRNA ligase [Microthrixaceae bacterium]
MTGEVRPHGGGVIDDLTARGLVQDHTDLDALRDRLDAGPTPTYCGFDPTADSLHIGNLQSIMLLRRFQDAGHPPIALVGGATGMIGDPSGRSSERTFLDTDVLDANRAAIGTQLARFLSFDGATAATVVDNRTWTESVSVLEFLRDVGKHVTINTMLAKDSVRSRMERESGISYTEFSYMLLQANDFDVLHQSHACDLQVAGSDQWGNITAGVDLVRRRRGEAVHGLTAPLIVRADGTKFGKSEGENIWLDAARTSPYRLYQYFLNVGDEDVEPLLLRLTTVAVEECRRIAVEHAAAPERRLGQRALARALTSVVHGSDAIAAIEEASAVLFGDQPITSASVGALDLLAAEVPSSTASRGDLLGSDPVDLVADEAVGLARS